jgi:hypothetical protein
MGGGPHARPDGAPPVPPAPAPTPPTPPPAATPVKGFSLFFGVLWDRIKRLFRRGR